MCMYMCVYVYMCMHVHVFVHVYMHVYVCARVCVLHQLMSDSAGLGGAASGKIMKQNCEQHNGPPGTWLQLSLHKTEPVTCRDWNPSHTRLLWHTGHGSGTLPAALGSFEQKASQPSRTGESKPLLGPQSALLAEGTLFRAICSPGD